MCNKLTFQSEGQSVVEGNKATITVVVDTNIFVSQLAQLRRLLDRSSNGGDLGSSGAVILYVPWAVFRELDALKSRWVGWTCCIKIRFETKSCARV